MPSLTLRKILLTNWRQDFKPAIIFLLGQDATEAFESIHNHSGEAMEMMQAFCVGQYVDVSFTFSTVHTQLKFLMNTAASSWDDML